MNNTKFFDKPQLLIAIIGILTFFASFVLFLIISNQQIVYQNESGETYVAHNGVLYSLLYVFVFAHLLMLIWFVIRAITYRLRTKEKDVL